MKPLLIQKMAYHTPRHQQDIWRDQTWFKFYSHRKEAPVYYSLLYLPANIILNGHKCTQLYLLPPNLSFKVSTDGVLIQSIQHYGSPLLLHSSQQHKIFAPSVTPPVLRCRTYTTCPLHTFGKPPGLFTPAYKIISFATFQKAFVVSGNISDYVNTQSDPQHCSLYSTFSLCQGVSGQHILDWRLHT